MCRPCSTGLTLIELLVALAIGLVLIALAWTIFVRAKSTTTRTTARIELHRSAAMIDGFLRDDCQNMAPATAFFAMCTPNATDPAHPTDPNYKTDTVQCVFMRSSAPLKRLSSQGTYDQYLADHCWIRWRFRRTWHNVDGVWRIVYTTLSRSTSTPTRVWTTSTTGSWIPAAPLTLPEGGSMNSYGGTTWVNIPRPIRDATWGIDALNFNRYNNPSASLANPATDDIGDLTDLDNNDSVISRQVRDVTIGWVDAQGTSTTISASAPAAIAIGLNGLHLDVVGPANGSYPTADILPASGPAGYDYKTDLRRRPRLMRITMNLADTAAGVTQDFAFSIQTPGLMPQIGQ